MSSLRIKPATDLKKPQGLLFYTKVGACKQQTTWLEYRYEISAEKFGPVLLNQQSYNKVADGLFKASSAEDLQRVMDKAKVLAIDPFISDTTAADVESASKAGNLVVGGNTGELTAIVDYGNPMWLNSSRPLAGSTQVSGKFGADGTLTEASAQVDNQTLSTILTAVTSLAGDAIPHIVAEPKPFQTTVKVSPRVHIHTRYQVLDPAKGLSPGELTVCKAPANPIEDGSWVVMDAIPPSDDSKKKKESDKPTEDKKP